MTECYQGQAYRAPEPSMEGWAACQYRTVRTITSDDYCIPNNLGPNPLVQITTSFQIWISRAQKSGPGTRQCQNILIFCERWRRRTNQEIYGVSDVSNYVASELRNLLTEVINGKRRNFSESHRQVSTGVRCYVSCVTTYCCYKNNKNYIFLKFLLQ
ncbi:unnamed protein product [Nezara viridula]|uniref:Uncharacterized protein n=1 Tax=Nezara viridula TaxID=85310 RepID=A0A9P0H6Z8_NEZVI|nr:unnamed protein product [Nezara viridula]